MANTPQRLGSLRLAGLCVALALIGCGSDDKAPIADASPSGPGHVTIAFKNNTPVGSALWGGEVGNETPDDFAVKLISVTLLENPAAPFDTPLIYLHPDCVDADNCTVADAPGSTAVITDYLEIQRPSEQVNQDLGATAYDVPAGSYPRVEMRWGRKIEDGFNARFHMDSWQASAGKEVLWGEFVIGVVTLSAPVEVPADADVLVTLNYNLENLLIHSQSIDGCPPGTEANCYSEGVDRWFILGLAPFSASVSVQSQ